MMQAARANKAQRPHVDELASKHEIIVQTRHTLPDGTHVLRLDPFDFYYLGSQREPVRVKHESRLVCPRGHEINEEGSRKGG